MVKLARLILSLALAALAAGEARAQSSFTIKDSTGTTQTVRSFNCTSEICPLSVPADSAGAALFGAAGSPSTNALTVQGISGGQAIPASAAQSGTWNITNVTGTVSLPTGAATSANQTNATQKTQVVDGSGNVVASTSNALNVSAAQSGTWNVSQGTASNLNATVIGSGTAGTANSGVVTVQGIASMTPVQVSQATAANLNATVVGTGTLAVQAAQSGNWTARVVGNAGGVLDAATGAAVPANALYAGMNQGGNLTGLTGTGGNLNVNLAASAATVTVSGTVTANQGGAPWSQNLTQVGGTNVVTGGASGLLAVGGPVASGGGNADNPLKVGGVFNTTQPTVTTGQVVDHQFTARGAAIVATGVDAFNVALAANQSVNLSQVNAVTTLTGAGASGTGAQRVTVSQDTTTLAGSAPGTAGTASANVVTVQGVASMTPVQVSQATAASLNATVVGTGTFAVQAAQSGTWNVTNISGTVSLPTGAATSANQTNASQKTQIVDGSGNVIASTSNNLNVQCANCSGSGVSTADEASFTAGSSLFAGVGGFFQTTATSNALTTGQQGMFQVTANRALFVNMRTAAGAEIGTAASPVQVSLANTAANGTAVAIGVADGASVTLGAKADSVCGTATGTCTLIQLTKYIANAVSSAIPAGSATIGNVGQVASIPTSGTLQSAAVANGNGTNLAVNGMSSAVLTVNCATCSGGTTVNFEASEDNTNFTNLTAVQVGTTTLATSTAASGVTVWQMPVGGFQNVRARVSAYSAGTVTVTGHTVPVPYGNLVSSTVTNQSVNLAQVNGVTTLTGAGVVGTGSARVAVGQDTTTIAGSAPGTAGAASANVVTIQGVASMTPVQVSQATAANLNATVVGTGTFATQSVVTQGTASNLNAAVVGVGTAGTASGGVLTVQGAASMTPLLANPGTAANWGVLAQNASTSGQLGMLSMGAVTTSAPSYTTAQTSPLSLDTAGNLRMNCVTGCGGGAGGTAAADEAAFTQGTTSYTPIGGIFNAAITNLTSGQGGAVQLTTDRMMFTNLGKVGGAAIALGQTTMSASVPVAIASNQGAVPVASGVNVTPTDCSGSITAGGTAQNAFSAQAALHGFMIVNFSTDELWISFTGTAAANTAASYPLNPGTSTTSGGSFSTPMGFGVNTAISIVGATTGDKFSCTRW